MISVENFYWILYTNLLNPTELNCFYYHPFGTTQNLCNDEFQSMYRRSHYNHVLFHFDQEPLWTDRLGEHYDKFRVTYSSRYVKILANSEISQFKKCICTDRYLLDWYFFYHGFAALDWFRDVQYTRTNFPFTKKFNSFNHIITNYRSYRISLTARLYELDLIKHGDVSFHGTTNDCLEEITKTHSKVSDQSKKIIEKNLLPLDKLPLIVDHANIDSTFSARLGHHEYKMWQRSFLHVVNETVFYESKLHLTEKIFKPIVSLRPFVLVAASGNLAYLKRYGFRTFDDWIDESYDDVIDPDARLDMIARQVSKICNLSIAELQEIYQDMLPILEFNKQHFFGEFRRIIVDELVENFDTCIRIWNNGRVDGRQLPLHPNLSQVKTILLQ
jgi:hypothetical protein